MQTASDDDNDDMPALSPETLANNTELLQAVDHYRNLNTFLTEAGVFDAALRQLIASDDAQSGAMLNYMYETGIPREAKRGRLEPLASFAARQYTSPAYVDILATLVEFGHDFDVTSKAFPRSERSYVEERAPGLFSLIRLKALLVANGSWPDYAHLDDR